MKIEISPLRQHKVRLGACCHVCWKEISLYAIHPGQTLSNSLTPSIRIGSLHNALVRLLRSITDFVVTSGNFLQGALSHAIHDILLFLLPFSSLFLLYLYSTLNTQHTVALAGKINITDINHHKSTKQTHSANIKMPSSKPKLADLPPLTKCLSLEETFNLADRARRKSTDKTISEDLRLKLGHTNVLESALKDIAVRSPPPSPTQAACSPYSYSAKPKKSERRQPSIKWATQTISYQYESTYDDAGFRYEDDGLEDFQGLSLVRTQSRKPKR